MSRAENSSARERLISQEVLIQELKGKLLNSSAATSEETQL